MMANMLWWTFYFYICNLQRTETVQIFKNFISPAPAFWYTKFQPSVASKTCMLTPDQGPCRDRIRMYYYQPEITNCSMFNWGGCQGNGNRFSTLSECLGYCLTSPDTGKVRPRYCQLTFDYGFCFGSSKRWFYDSKWKVCKSTIYSGCGGNKNNFYSKQQCDQICRFGNPPIASLVDSKGLKKVLIINPEKPDKDKAPPVARSLTTAMVATNDTKLGLGST